MKFRCSLLACWLTLSPLAIQHLEAAEALWKAGVARANITPTQPLWLAGYGGRDKPADGKVMDLWIKVLALEKSHTNATAMFFMGCGGDQNPLPRRRLELAERYGDMLASAVEEVLLSPATNLPPKLDTTMEMVTLHLGPAPTESELEKMKLDKVATTARYATRLLAELKAGKPFIRTYSYPLQAWRFGGKQLLLTLGGEPVVDYTLKFKKSFGAQTWVAGYCSDVMTYIPSLRVLNEDKPPLKVPRWGQSCAHRLWVAGRQVGGRCRGPDHGLRPPSRQTPPLSPF
jgi:hypothetical protein